MIMFPFSFVVLLPGLLEASLRTSIEWLPLRILLQKNPSYFSPWQSLVA